MQRISPNSTAMTRTSPATPGRMKPSQASQPARSAPPVSMTRGPPNRATSRPDSREPISPPVQGTANASPYCQGANPRRPSMRTASSGSVAMISPLNVRVLKNSGRSTGWARMCRHPSSRSPARRPAAPWRAGRGSAPPIARIPAADSR